MPSDPANKELHDLVLAADDDALKDGFDPKGRTLEVLRIVMTKLGYTSFVIAGEHEPLISKRIRQMHSALYRQSDLAIGGLHGGVFMFRDVFARIDVPIIFGTVKIDPFTLTDLSPNQLSWLKSRPADMQMFLDQFTDVFDFGGGISNLGSFTTPPPKALEMFQLAAFQLQGAAATLQVAFDFRAAVQSALIGTELALKAGLLAAGQSESDVRVHGHNIASAAKALHGHKKAFDLVRVLAAVQTLPPYVANRYSAAQPSRIETGHIVMKAQYVAGEVMRQVTGHSIRNPANPRTYPPTAP